jgi:hypothetical protein
LDDDIAAGRIRGPLHGIPVLLKDNISTGDGMPMSAGSVALAKFVPKHDAAIVQRLRRAGALILGKTNLTEFADDVSDVMPSGFSGVGGMVKNPQTMREYGRGLGSSVGSAAAVAVSLAPGKVQALGITSLERLPQLPDLPTIAETVPGYEASWWYGLFAPRGTPHEVVTVINTENQKILIDPDFRATVLKPKFYKPVVGSVEQFTKYVDATSARWKSVMQTAVAPRPGP